MSFGGTEAEEIVFDGTPGGAGAWASDVKMILKQALAL